MEIDELKDEILKIMESESAVTIQDLCGRLKLDDDFDIVMSITELEDEGRIKGHESLQIYREDGGAILLSRYQMA